MRKIYIVTHNDLDGVSAAAIYFSLAKKAFNISVTDAYIGFVEPSGLINLLSKSIKFEPESTLAIMDIGMNENLIDRLLNTLSNLRALRINVEWFDHHIWSTDWIEKLKSIDVAINVDVSTCGAGVVEKHAFPNVDREECHDLLVRITCGADLWRWDDPLSPLLYRMTKMPRSKAGDAFRRHLIEEFSACRIFNDKLLDRAEDNFDSELRGYYKALSKTEVLNINGRRVGVIYRELDHPGISLTANYLIGRLNLDLAVVIKPDGSVSFRSRSGIARDYALCFEGGGHPNASGGKIRISKAFKMLTLIPFLREKVFRYIAKRKLPMCDKF